MRYSSLAVLVTSLLAAFGPVQDGALTILQEDCAGCGSLTAGVREWGLAAQRRDVSHMKVYQLWSRCSTESFNMFFILQPTPAQSELLNLLDKASHVWAIHRPRHAQIVWIWGEIWCSLEPIVWPWVHGVAACSALEKLVNIQLWKLFDSEFAILCKYIDRCI